MVDTSYQTKTYHQRDGDRYVIASGGSLDVESGGEIDIESGGAFKIAGVAMTATAAELNAIAGGGLSAAELGVLDGALSAQIVASKAVIADAAGKINLMRLGSGAASASGLLLGVGTTAAPATTSTADGKFVEMRCKTSATSGDNRLMYMRYELAAAGGGECLRAFTKLAAAVVTARGAHISLDLDDSPAGSVSGLGVGLDGQLLVGNAALPAGGTYFAGQSEIYSAGSSSDVSAATACAIHSFIAGGDATGAATVLNALAFKSADGAGDGKMIDTTAVETGDGDGSIRILIDEGAGYLVKYLHYWDGPG